MTKEGVAFFKDTRIQIGLIGSPALHSREGSIHLGKQKECWWVFKSGNRCTPLFSGPGHATAENFERRPLFPKFQPRNDMIDLAWVTCPFPEAIAVCRRIQIGTTSSREDGPAPPEPAGLHIGEEHPSEMLGKQEGLPPPP